MDILELIIFGVLSVTLVALYIKFFRKFHSAEPNEWMLIMRNGKVIECGIGISYYSSWVDVVVKFPSQINKIRFSAQQVTQEMQGLEVSGIIIWSIYREKDGPLKAFKYLGEDIKTSNPATANEQMIEISNAIVRHRIANSTIDEVIKNRELVRDEIRKEMNEIVNGWGIWLESIEITDVKILSQGLFKDLQTEFRKEQQQKAEYIKMETESDLKDRRLKTEIEYARKQAETESNKTIYKLAEAVKVSKDQYRVSEEQQKIEKKNVDINSTAKIFETNKNNEYLVYTKTQNLQQELKKIDQDLNLRKKEFEIDLENHKVNLFLQNKNLEKINLEKDAEIKKLQEDLALDNKLLLSQNPKIRIFNSILEIYQHMPIKEMKIFNYGENKDPVAGLVNQIQGTVEEMMKQVKVHA